MAMNYLLTKLTYPIRKWTFYISGVWSLLISGYAATLNLNTSTLLAVVLTSISIPIGIFWVSIEAQKRLKESKSEPIIVRESEVSYYISLNGFSNRRYYRRFSKLDSVSFLYKVLLL